MAQAHVFFKGMVQGIGFRYTVQRMASDLGLKGWVKNLSDGRVEMVADGSWETIEKLLSKLDEHFKSYIRNTEIAWQNSSGQFEDFRITH